LPSTKHSSGDIITWENVPRGRCVVCSSELKDRGYYYCVNCKNPAEIELRPLAGGPRMVQLNPVLFLADAKSKCCRADLEVRTRITCSDKCHRNFVNQLIKQFGEFKLVVDQTSGKTYKVPTKEIIEKGLKWRDLSRYPEFVKKEPPPQPRSQEIPVQEASHP
jgi:hypothetical protein